MNTQPLQLVIPKDSGLEIESMQSLATIFQPFFEQAEDWRQKALQIIVTDATQLHEMRMARESRLALREIRCRVESERKRLKEDSLKKGKAIDGLANVFKSAVEPIEQYLLEQEKFAERVEAERVRVLGEQRKEQLAFLEYVHAGPDLGTLSEGMYQRILQDAKDLVKGREEREEQEEQEEKKRAEDEVERSRIKAENEKLKAEALVREKEMAAERKKMADAKAAADAKVKAEREAREKVEAELKAKQEAEVKKAQAEKAAAKKAAKAPEVEKLRAFAGSIRCITVPDVSCKKQIERQVELLAQFIDLQIETL